MIKYNNLYNTSFDISSINIQHSNKNSGQIVYYFIRRLHEKSMANFFFNKKIAQVRRRLSFKNVKHEQIKHEITDYVIN